MADRPSGKTYKRVARTHAIKPENWPLETKGVQVRVAAPRLPQNVGAQNRTGRGNPWR